MTALAYAEADRRIANVAPAEQRARHRSFADKIRKAAESLARSKMPPPPVGEAVPVVLVEPPPVPHIVCVCEHCRAAFAKAGSAEPDPPPQVYPKITQIRAEVAAFFGVPVLDLISARRSYNVVRPRQIAMYLARTLTPKSMQEIGRRFGGRDHTTVIHAVRKIGTLLPNDADLAFQVAHLFNIITGEQQ